MQFLYSEGCNSRELVKLVSVKSDQLINQLDEVHIILLQEIMQQRNYIEKHLTRNISYNQTKLMSHVAPAIVESKHALNFPATKLSLLYNPVLLNRPFAHLFYYNDHTPYKVIF